MTNRQEQLARMELNRKNRMAAGLVSERFPEVAGMIIRMIYFQKMLNPVLMERTVNVAPTGHAYFNMTCMVKGCTGGGFDLSPVITGMVKGRKKTAKGSIVCKGRSADFAPGHASVSYDIQIDYSRKKERPAVAAAAIAPVSAPAAKLQIPAKAARPAAAPVKPQVPAKAVRPVTPPGKKARPAAGKPQDALKARTAQQKPSPSRARKAKPLTRKTQSARRIPQRGRAR